MLIALMFQPQILIVAASVTATFALVSYVLVTASFARARLRGKWQTPAKGTSPSVGPGCPSASPRSCGGVSTSVNLAWPRPLFYDPVEPFRHHHGGNVQA